MFSFVLQLSNYTYILNYLLALDHPRSLLVDLKLHIKFCVDRVRTFQDIAI